MKVEVWAGDGKTYLGLGEMVGRVSVYFFRQPNGSLASLSNCEERPSEKLIAEAQTAGIELIEEPGNPKIVLENGETVYGCQVWWQPVSTSEKRE